MHARKIAVKPSPRLRSKCVCFNAILDPLQSLFRSTAFQILLISSFNAKQRKQLQILVI
nr:MAG TPA: hypothetical protein [Caudoviricetes sp.]